MKPPFQDDRRALAWACPSCGSKAGENCTAPTDAGWRRVPWLHYARTDMVRDLEVPQTQGDVRPTD